MPIERMRPAAHNLPTSRHEIPSVTGPGGSIPSEQLKIPQSPPTNAFASQRPRKIGDAPPAKSEKPPETLPPKTRSTKEADQITTVARGEGPRSDLPGSSTDAHPPTEIGSPVTRRSPGNDGSPPHPGHKPVDTAAKTPSEQLREQLQKQLVEKTLERIKPRPGTQRPPEAISPKRSSPNETTPITAAVRWEGSGQQPRPDLPGASTGAHPPTEIGSPVTRRSPGNDGSPPHPGHKPVEQGGTLDTTAKAASEGLQEQLAKMAALLHAYEDKFTDPKRAPRWPALMDRITRVKEIYSQEGRNIIESGPKGDTSKDLSAQISQAYKSPDSAVKLEGEAGMIAREHSTVVSFQDTVWVAGRKGAVGENDVVTKNAIIEATIKKDAGSRKGGQSLDKVTDTITNPLGKPVVVYAPNWSGLTIARIEAQSPKILVARTPDQLAFILKRLPGLE